jgi:hypothetical protein
MYRSGFTDGLPIVPPTPERVEDLLRASGRDSEEVVAVLEPSGAEATVQALAVNAVMAGCLPEYLPVLISAIDAIAHEDFNLLGIQSTTGSPAPVVIVNGPIARRLEMNLGAGALGPGNRANATIGRALSLILRNVGGARPGEEDMASLGQPAKYGLCFPENEEESPWPSLHADLGFASHENTLTVAAISGYVEVVDVFSRDADGLLATLAGAVAGTCLAGQTATHRAVSPVLVLTPEHAHQLAERFTKTLVKQGVWEQASLSLEQVGPRVKQQVMERRLRRGGEDVNGPLRPCPTPEDIIVVVAGGIGQKSAYLPAWYGGSKAQIRPIRT